MPGHPPGRRDRILDGGGKFVLGSETVANGNEATSRHLCERRADTVMGIDTAGDHAAAVEEHEARQMFGGLIRGGIKPVGNIAPGARQYAVDPGYCRHVGARELLGFWERLATLA